MRIACYDASGVLLHEQESEWTPREDSIHGQWIERYVDGEDLGYWEVIGHRRYEVLVLWSVGGAGFLDHVTADGIPVGSNLNLDKTPNVTVALTRHYEEVPA